jgi:hypothetical protein
MRLTMCNAPFEIQPPVSAFAAAISSEIQAKMILRRCRRRGSREYRERSSQDSDGSVALNKVLGALDLGCGRR